MYLIKKNSFSPSVCIAKERLKHLLVADRIQCKPQTYELLCNDLYRTISKYMKVEKEYFDVEITQYELLIKLIGEKS